MRRNGEPDDVQKADVHVGARHLSTEHSAQ